MKTLRFLVVIVSLLSLRAAPAQERQGQWLIGRWDGIIEGYSGKDGPNRTLRVIDVGPDSKRQATFSTSPRGTTTAELTVEGAKVRVVTLSTRRVVEVTR